MSIQGTVIAASLDFNQDMTYYNTLVAEKLKTISEIQSTNKLIDANKKAGEDFAVHLEKLTHLKIELELLNAQILSVQLNQGDQSSEDSTLSILRNSESPAEEPVENDLTDHNPDDTNLLSGPPEMPN